MKFSFFLIIIFSFLIPFNLFTQSPDLLKADGEIPLDFIMKSTEKYKKQVKEINKKKSSKSERRDKKKFYLEANFGIDEILQSGMVLFNDPVSEYVNKVLQNLPFEDIPKLKDKNPRVYTLNSSAVNAFATDQGIIFVTIGLIAKLENEAQLAFILSHELMHIKHQHSVDKFINSKNIDKESDRNKNMGEVGVDRNIFKKSLYSRSIEEEADADGFELFLKSDYDPNVILNTFKILYYSYLPFEELTFEKDFFEDNNYILPSLYWKDSINQISPMDATAEEEKNSSHPSSSKRLLKLKNKIEETADNNNQKKAFLLPKTDFLNIQKTARYQIPFLNLYTENFPEAIYTSYILLQKNPTDIHLLKIIGKALYMEAKYSNSGSYNHNNFDLDRIEGESHQVYNLLKKISKRDLSILALKYNWKIYQNFPEDEELKLFVNDMFIEFASHFDNLDDFKRIPSIIPENNKIDSTVTKEAFWKYAFISEFKNKDFLEGFEKGLKDLKEREEKEDYYNSDIGKREFYNRKKEERKKGKSFGIKKVVVVNPFYLSIDSRKKKGIQYIRTEEKQTYFSNAIKKYAPQSKIDAHILDVTQLSPNEVDKFNDIVEINHYFSQQMNHDELYLTPAYNQNQINEIAEKYDTEYFLWTGVISLREKNNLKPLLIGIFAPYVLPVLVPSVVKPEYDMLFYAILFDIKTGRRSVIKMDYFDKKDSKTILNAHIYDVFYQIQKD